VLTQSVAIWQTRPKPLSLEAYRNPNELTHRLFRFPGRFHPPLVTYLLSLHPNAKIVGDPMVGSGSVAVETVATGRSGIFSDVDPLSCLLTRAKSHPVNPSWLEDTIGVIVDRAQLSNVTSPKQSEARKYIRDLEGSTKFRAPPDIFHWFRPYVAINLCKTLQLLEDVKCSDKERDALLAVFAGAIRRLSRADPNTSSGLEVTRVRRKALQGGLKFDVSCELLRRANLLSNGYRQLLEIDKLGNSLVTQYDAKDWSVLCEQNNLMPDLIITSPCYISAIEYWRRHKLEYTWLGLVPPDDLSKVKQAFLGMGDQEVDVTMLPRRIKIACTKFVNMKMMNNAKILARYFADSFAWLREIAKIIEKTNGVAYVVVGSNTSRGISLDTPTALVEIAREVGLDASIFTRYKIKNSFMQYPTKGKRIRLETILKIIPS
jgi:hypothetical protein